MDSDWVLAAAYLHWLGFTAPAPRRFSCPLLLLRWYAGTDRPELCLTTGAEFPGRSSASIVSRGKCTLFFFARFLVNFRIKKNP
jgi:hypothetical protein